VVELVTVLKAGWARLRIHTFNRDGGCVAVQPSIFGADIATDQCRSATGTLIPWNAVFFMEWDHVTDRAGIRRDDEAHGVTVCPWHHRGSGWRIDTKERRAVLRDHLTRLYPEAWAR
jgi:hypothetical protein